MKNHNFRFALSVLMLLFASNMLRAQDDYGFYLQKARQRLAEGDCESAQRNYNVYKELSNKTDKTVENMIAECGHEQKTVSGSADGHEWVDLGLPSGTLWATCNVGASKPEDYGSYFAWGETSTKSSYNWETYKYDNGNFSKLTKYCTKSDRGDNGFTDNLTTLQSSDDAATANWGSGWCTPSKMQWEELLANTTNQWTKRKGKAGVLFTSKKNGQTVFLPAVGHRWDSVLNDAGFIGNYWSRSIQTDNPFYAWSFYFNFNLGSCGMNYYGSRGYGFSVRPVRVID